MRLAQFLFLFRYIFAYIPQRPRMWVGEPMWPNVDKVLTFQIAQPDILVHISASGYQRQMRFQRVGTCILRSLFVVS